MREIRTSGSTRGGAPRVPSYSTGSENDFVIETVNAQSAAGITARLKRDS